ncbi:cell wall-binding repeat-containing protein [Peptostreptococcus porci]|nr:cell wall-binding repeat-containing protein [Peptostreptococcus porci]
MKIKSSLVLLTLCGLFVGSTNYSNAQEFRYTRYEGVDREKTSIASSELSTSNVGADIVIADGYSFADSLSAMNISNRFNSKLLLDGRGKTDASFISYVANNFKPRKIYLVGGVVSNKIENDKIGNTEIIRISGADRYETNKKTLAIANYKDVGVASGVNYADALSSYSLLREKNIGILLYNPKGNNLFGNYNIKYTFGGNTSVAQNYGERIAGNDRYETSLKIANKTSNRDIVFVSGKTFADALSSINLVNSKKADIILTPDFGSLATKNISEQADNIFVVGGKDTLPDKNIQNAIRGIKKSNTDEADNISGFNLAFRLPDDLKQKIEISRSNYLNESDLMVRMKNPYKGNLFLIFVSDFEKESSSGNYERNIGTLNQNGKNYSVFLFIGKMPEYNDEATYFSTLNSVLNSIEKGALAGTKGSKFTLNRDYFDEMRAKFDMNYSNSNDNTMVNFSIPNTDGKASIILPRNVARKLKWSEDGSRILHKELYSITGDEDASMILMMDLIKYVGTNANTHIAASMNTFGTIEKKGKKYSLYVDNHLGISMFGSDYTMSDEEIKEMNMLNKAIMDSLSNKKTVGIIH